MGVCVYVFSVMVFLINNIHDINMSQEQQEYILIFYIIVQHWWNIYIKTCIFFSDIVPSWNPEKKKYQRDSIVLKMLYPGYYVCARMHIYHNT